MTRILAIALIVALAFGQGLSLSFEGDHADKANAHALFGHTPEAPPDVDDQNTDHEGGDVSLAGSCSVASCIQFTRADISDAFVNARASRHLWTIPDGDILRAAALERDPPVPRLPS